jgi:hypothetical protein
MPIDVIVPFPVIKARWNPPLFDIDMMKTGGKFKKVKVKEMSKK